MSATLVSSILTIGGLAFEVRRSPRRLVPALTVDRGGALVIHSPDKTTDEELTRWTSSKLLWVHRKLAHKEALAVRVREPEFVSGESFFYLGRSYRLKLTGEQEEPLRLEGTQFFLRRDEADSGAAHFRRWYISAGNEWFSSRMSRFAQKVGAAPARVEVRDLGFRWGSCSRAGVVRFNWRLLQLSARLNEYVAVHELAHLIEPHHGPEFWRLLDRSLPDWQERRKELSIRAGEVYWCRPPASRQTSTEIVSPFATRPNGLGRCETETPKSPPDEGFSAVRKAARSRP